MLNFKKEYFKLEEGRQQYATSFSDLMTSCEVYGKKQNPITSTAFIFLIPKDYYTYNAGNIDFTNYPDGIWNDYTDIKIVKSEPYFDLDFTFSSTGDITPENLNQQFKKIKDYFLETQKEIVEKQAFLDSGIPEQLGLPKLPIGCIWYQDTDGLVALPVSKYYSMFEELINNLKKILEIYKDDLKDELIKNADDLIEEMTKEKDSLILLIQKEGEKQVKNVTNEGERQLEILNQASEGLPNRVTEIEKNIKVFKTENETQHQEIYQEIEASEKRNIDVSRIPDRSLSSSKFKIGSNADRIKLENLSDEVKLAMIGDTPVSPTLEENSVVREYIADGAINDEKIDGLGVTLRGITKSLEKNIILERGNGGANILNGKAIKTATLDNETLSLALTYQDETGFDGVMFDESNGIFEIRISNSSIYIIIGSNQEKTKYYTIKPSGKNIEIGQITNGYSTIGGVSITENINNLNQKIKVTKDKIIIYNTSNNDAIAYEITTDTVPEVAEAFDNQRIGMMVWGTFVNSNPTISLFAQYLENSNLNMELNNLKDEINNFSDEIYVEKKLYATNKDITLDNPNAITIGVETISYNSATNETTATKKSDSAFVWIGYKYDTMDIYLKAGYKYLLIGISSENEDEIFFYNISNGNITRFNNKTNALTQSFAFGKGLSEYVPETKLTCSYKNGILKIFDENTVYADGNLDEKLDELLIKDFSVGFGKQYSPIRADFTNGEDISIKEQVNKNIQSIDDTNTRITDEAEKLNTRIDSIITSGGGSDNSVDVVLFMGQSNMAGRGVASEAPVVPEGMAYEFRAISDPSKLYPIVEPFGVNENNPDGINEPGAKVGSMVSSLVIEYCTYSGRKIVGISASKGGTTITSWLPGRSFLNDIRQRLNTCLQYLSSNQIPVRDIFMFWCQGESDGDYDTSKEDYKTRFNSMWEFMRDELGVSKCFIIRIGYLANNNIPNKYASIIEAQRELCEYSDELILVSTRFDSMQSEGLMKDSFHYKQEGYNLTGADAGKNTAYYLKTGRKPSFYDWHYNDIYIPKYGTNKGGN